MDAATLLQHSLPTDTLRWSFEPWVVALLAASLAAHLLGLARLWRHAGAGRGVHFPRAVAFLGGWLILALALVSPLDTLGHRLFSVHMLQHELLMVAAAPLLVLGKPLALWAWALPFDARRRVGAAFRHPGWRRFWHVLTAPLTAWLLYAAALWAWHLPSCFEAALASNALHVLQHASFVFSALLFWWSVLGHAARAAQGVALVSVLTTMLHTAALGALLSLSNTVWYPHYLATVGVLGGDALDDLQLGGLVMSVPAGVAYVVSALVLAARWIGLRPRAMA